MEIKKYIKENKENLSPEQITNLLMTISSAVFDDINLLLKSQEKKDIEISESEKDFVKIYVEHAEQLGLSRHIVEIIKALDDKEYLKQCIENRDALKLENWDTVQLIDATNDTDYIKSCAEHADELNIAEHEITLVAMSNDPTYIKKYYENKKTDISKNSAMYLFEKLAEIGDLEFIQEVISNYGLTVDEQTKLIKAGGKDFAKGYVFNDAFGRDIKLNLMEFIDEPQFSLEAIEKNIFALPADNLTFSLEIFEKYGLHAFKNIEDDMFSKKAIEILGKDNVELLIKYYKVAGKNVGLKDVLNHEESFEQYSQLRKTLFSQGQLEALDLYNTINEFSRNYELISNCMKEELSDEEKQLLSIVVKESIVTTKGQEDDINTLFGKYMNLYMNSPDSYEKPIKIRQEISQMSEEAAKHFLFQKISGEKVGILTKEDLKDYPQIRQNEIAKLQDKDQITYLLTGMKWSEYQRKVEQFLTNDKIDEALSALDAENASALKNIKAVNEMIDLILGMEPEKRKEALNKINAELVNEFTEHGSEIANMRKQFRDIDVQIRKIYGKELSDTLLKVEMPASTFDEEKGVDIIKLEGQDFKLLIHGVDAYTKSTGKFEERNVGKSFICTSLISEKTLLRAKAGCYYGFSNIGSNALIMSGNDDINSYADSANSLEVKANGNAEFNTSTQIIDKSIENGTYSEIDLWREYIGDDGKIKKVTPDYIISFSSKGISENDIKEAKRLGIPIVLIDEEKYMQKNKVEDKVEGKASNEEIPEEKITPKNIKKWWSKIGDVVPALKENEAFQTIVNEMNKEIKKEGPAIGE